MAAPNPTNNLNAVLAQFFLSNRVLSNEELLKSFCSLLKSQGELQQLMALEKEKITKAMLSKMPKHHI